MIGQMQTGMYYGTPAGYGSQTAPGTPGMSHMSMSPQGSAASAYPSSPGHSASYGMQTNQQVSVRRSTARTLAS